MCCSSRTCSRPIRRCGPAPGSSTWRSVCILFRHLRYFTYPVPGARSLSMETGCAVGLATFSGWHRCSCSGGGWRCRARSIISGLPDYFALVLLGADRRHGHPGQYWLHVYLVDVKAFMLGLLTLRPVAPPQHPLFLVHFVLVLALMLYFPFSKLLHAGGIFFSPTRNQPYQVQTARQALCQSLGSRTSRDR